MSTDRSCDPVRVLKMNVAEHHAAVTTLGGMREIRGRGRCY